MNANPYENPSTPTRSADAGKRTASIAAAHKDPHTNDMSSVTYKSKMPGVGKLGIKGDGRQK